MFRSLLKECGSRKLISMLSNKWKKKIAAFNRKLTFLTSEVYKEYKDEDSILLKYWDFVPNWGDTVNPYLVQKITGRNTVSSNKIFNYKHKPELLGIGSIISGDLSNFVIWGSGVLSAETTIYHKPKEVLALRGHNSLKKIREVGGDCNVFGDPVLLFPEIFSNVNIAKTHRYGIVPHYSDKTKPGIVQLAAMNDASVKIIDIQTDTETFVKDVLSCENIISSSLHGLILAEAYGIPTCRIMLSENLKRGDFKFYDYYSGVGIKTMDTVLIHDNINKWKEAFLKCSVKDISFNKNELSGSIKEYFNNAGRK